MFYCEQTALAVNKALNTYSMVTVDLTCTPFDIIDIVKNMDGSNKLLVTSEVLETGSKIKNTNQLSIKTLISIIAEIFDTAGINRYTDYTKETEPDLQNAYVTTTEFFKNYDTVVLANVDIFKIATEIEEKMGIDTTLAVYSVLFSLFESDSKIAVINCKDFSDQCMLYKVSEEMCYMTRFMHTLTMQDIVS